GEDAARKVTLTREKIHVDTVLGDGRKPDGSWDYMFKPREHIGYVRLVAFSRDTAGELRRVLTQLKNEKMRGLIIDLRFNPGGLLSAAIETSDLFISKGRIVSAEGRNSPKRAWDAHEEGTFEGIPMAVLVNRYSASSSEIVAACLQDHRRAGVVGERTWGKGSVQNLIELADGRGALKLTTSSYRRPNGKNIHRFPNAKEGDEWGVTPDESYRITLDGREMLELIRDRRERDILHPPATEVEKPPFVDRQLQAAVKYLTAEARKNVVVAE
ncbi:MAG: S41 family peptidase, partial [Planctomycetes bacterium]|nr:S41 family peptidase [Planctomycetota bacterium]